MISESEYYELENAIVVLEEKIIEELSPCRECTDECLGMPDRCEKAIYKPGTRPHEIKERIENIIANDKNRKYLDSVEYCQFEDSIFDIKWFVKYGEINTGIDRINIRRVSSKKGEVK